MNLRSKAIATIKAPAPAEIPVPCEREPGSIDFLVLPDEIRKLVYREILVTKSNISLADGENNYRVLNWPNGAPSLSANPADFSGLAFHSVQSMPQDAQTVSVHRPINCSLPTTPNPLMRYIEPGESGLDDQEILPAKATTIIPFSNVVQPADLSRLPLVQASTKGGMPLLYPWEPPTSMDKARFIGPINTAGFTYLPPSVYFPSNTFNAKIMQTCKTVYTEALPILYGKNTFSIYCLPYQPLLSGLNGRSLAQIISLRLNICNLPHIFEGGSTGLWSRILHGASNLHKVTLACRDEKSYEHGDTSMILIRIAVNIANVKKGTGQPILVAKVKMKPPSTFHKNTTFYWNGQTISNVMSRKSHDKMQLPRGMKMEVMGSMSFPDLQEFMRWNKKGWYFNMTSPASMEEVEADSWVELEWVKSQK